MKIRKNFILLCILSLLSADLHSISQPKGRELCQKSLDFLKTRNFSPKIQNIFTISQNNFPYNIYLEFNQKEKLQVDSDNLSKNILLVFPLEEAFSNREGIADFLKYVEFSSKSLNLTTTVLFSYGDTQKTFIDEEISKISPVYGSESFIENYYSQSDYTAVYVNLNQPQNDISAASSKTVSPGRLLQLSLNAFLQKEIDFNYKKILLSQIYSLSIKKDRILNIFFSREIPAIRLSFGQEEDNEKIIKSLTCIYDAFSLRPDFTQNWEQHFILIRGFSRYHLISEKEILSLVLAVIAVILLFIFVFGYINSFIKFQAWKNIRYVWYAAPMIFLLTILGFFTGKAFFFNFSPKSIYGSIFLLLWLQLFFSILFLSFFYLPLAFYNHKFSDRSIDFLVLLSTFINQSIFGCIDISLFPLFLLIFTAAFFTIFFRKFFSHFYLLLILIALLWPYCNKFLSTFDGREAADFFINSNSYHIVVSLVLTPIMLLYLRLLIKFRQNHPGKKELTLFVAVFSLLLLLIQSLICLIVVPLRNKGIKESVNPVFTSVSEQKVSLTRSDKNIFDDIVRTITITTKEPAEICNVLVFSPNSQPVEYSDYDFEPINSTSSYFSVPVNPPQTFSFTYGTTKDPCFVKITAIFESRVDNEYILEERLFSVSED